MVGIMRGMHAIGLMAALAAGAFGQAVSGTAGAMQVEEPGFRSSPPIDPERESEAWHAKAMGGLTDRQKEILKARKERMKEMVALIKAQRESLKAADPEERAKLARELRELILDKDQPGKGIPEHVGQMQQEHRARLLEQQEERMRLFRERLLERAREAQEKQRIPDIKGDGDD